LRHFSLGSSDGRRRPWFKIRWFRFICRQQGRNVFKEDLPEHPTIVGLIIAFPLNVEFMSPLQNTRRTNTAHLVHIGSINSRQRARRLIDSSKLRVPSLKEFQSTNIHSPVRLTKRSGQIPCHLSPLDFQHHKRNKLTRCQLIGHSHFNVTRIQPYLITYFDDGW